MNDKNAVPALIEVIYEAKGTVVQREILLIWYSSEEYPSPETFREYLKIELHKDLREQEKITGVKSDVGSFSVANKTNDIVGYFLDSGKFPGLLARAKNFVVKFSRE